MKGEIWRHIKRGNYCTVIGDGKLQTEHFLADNSELVIYREIDGTLWARRKAEFFDGRFEKVPTTPEPLPYPLNEIDRVAEFMMQPGVSQEAMRGGFERIRQFLKDDPVTQS